MIDELKKGLKWQDVDLVRNEVKHIINAMDPAEYPDRSGLKYYLDVELPEFQMSNVFQRIIRLEGREKPPVTTGGISTYEGCSFRLEEILAGTLQLTPPARNFTLLSTVASLTTKYRLREMVEPGLRDRYLATRVAMRAGLALRDFVGYEHSFFSRYQAENRQFLTWQPNGKTVSNNQREYLYFLLNINPLPTEIRLRVRVNRPAGTETFTAATLIGAQEFQVVCAQAGVLELGLDSKVTSYEVWLSDEENKRLTEVRSYKIDTRRELYEKNIIFANSFGCYDSLRLIGKSSEQTDVFKNVARKERENDKGLEFSELQIISVSENSGIKISTGFFRENASQYLDYLRELLLSDSIYLETEHGYEALNLDTSNLEYKSDDPGLIERSFVFRRTYSDKNYSRMSPVEKRPARSTKWVGASTMAVLDEFGKRTGYLTYERLQKVYRDNGDKVIPYEIKPNLPGDPDYIPSTLEPSIVPGSTDFPNEVISRAIEFKKNDCGDGYVGTAPVVTIAAGAYGGEIPGDADGLAEKAWNLSNTQEYANTHGACQLNNVPINYAIFHKIPMDDDLKVIGNGDFGPVVDLRLNGNVIIHNTYSGPVPAIRLSDAKHMPGKVNLVMGVTYRNYPFYPCRLKILGKNIDLVVTKPGFYVTSVEVTTSDEPLTVEVVQL